jgi:hypothetical protein
MSQFDRKHCKLNKFYIHFNQLLLIYIEIFTNFTKIYGYKSLLFSPFTNFTVFSKKTHKMHTKAQYANSSAFNL